MTHIEELEKLAKELTVKYFGKEATEQQYNIILASVAAGAESALAYVKKNLQKEKES